MDDLGEFFSNVLGLLFLTLITAIFLGGYFYVVYTYARPLFWVHVSSLFIVIPAAGFFATKDLLRKARGLYLRLKPMLDTTSRETQERH